MLLRHFTPPRPLALCAPPSADAASVAGGSVRARDPLGPGIDSQAQGAGGPGGVRGLAGPHGVEACVGVSRVPPLDYGGGQPVAIRVRAPTGGQGS